MRSHQVKMESVLPLFSIFLLVGAEVGCTSSNGAYQRGQTVYQAGRADVRQPDLSQVPPRTFDGLRVAGYDTDVDPVYWDRLFQLQGETATFETFAQRHKDLQVYKTGGEDAALKSFRQWCSGRGLAQKFDAFWGARI